jgi:hypothetical protein
VAISRVPSLRSGQGFVTSCLPQAGIPRNDNLSMKFTVVLVNSDIIDRNGKISRNKACYKELTRTKRERRLRDEESKKDVDDWFFDHVDDFYFYGE